MKTLRNATYSPKDERDIEQIKNFILERKTQLQMSEEMGLHRTTINRKIARWVKTPDFRNWIKEAWTYKLGQVDPALAFKGLTILMRPVLKYEIESQQGQTQEPLAFRWMTEQEWSNKLSSTTARIVGKDNFIKAKQDSECLVVEDAGAKPVVAQTNSLN